MRSMHKGENLVLALAGSLKLIHCISAKIHYFELIGLILKIFLSCFFYWCVFQQPEGFILMCGSSMLCHNSQVFIPMALSSRVSKIFECVRRGMEMGSVPKHGRKIDYESLTMGSLQEVRHMFARIVFDTVYPTKPK